MKQRIQSRLVVVAGVLAFGTALLAADGNSNGNGGQTSTAAGSTSTQNVNVVNPTLNVSVTGTPTVSVTGTPTVQVTNTPNVQVTNTPNVQVTNTPNVLVTNSASNPVIIQNRDSTARNPYYSENFCNQPTNGYCLIDLTTVPAGMRLVIEYVTVLNQMPAAGTITSMDLRKKGTNVIVAFLPTAANPVNTNYTTSEKILAYFDAGETPEVLTFTNSAAGFTSIATVSGYLINIP